METLFEFLSGTTDGVFAVDREQRIVYWNRAVRELLGHSAADVLGKHCYDVIAGKDDRRCAVCQPSCRAIMGANHGKPMPAVDILVQLLAGREIWLNVSTLLVPSCWQDLSVLVHFCRDATRSHEARRQMDQVHKMVGQSIRPPAKSRKARPATTPLHLTTREQEVLTRLAAGESTTGVARSLFISPVTVRNHIQSILGKLGVHSRLEAVTLALRRNLL